MPSQVGHPFVPVLYSFPDVLTSTSIARSTFILYLLDAIRAVFFQEQPKILFYEIGLQLPSHESLFNCKTRVEWEALSSQSRLTALEYPALLSYFLCGKSHGATIHLSVMGDFIVLHGKS